jgi:uncharacterized protein YbjT (DUF2867 family)
VSVRDVSALVERAVRGPLLRSECIDVAGPDNLTLTEVAALLGATKVRRIPRGALRLLATVAAPIAPAMGRQGSAALVMDTADMTADPTALHARFPNMTWHRAAEVVR